VATGVVVITASYDMVTLSKVPGVIICGPGKLRQIIVRNAKNISLLALQRKPAHMGLACREKD
jgi:hypothetical protein